MLVNATALEIPLADESVDMVVTSPPYWGLRKYSGKQGRLWPEMAFQPYPGASLVTVPLWEGGLGLEPTPDMHVAHMIHVFRGIWRVLKPDGVVYLNYGDSYSTSPPGSGNGNMATSKRAANDGLYARKMSRMFRDGIDDTMDQRGQALTNGNLLLIPHRVALGLQGAGWLVRNDLVWAKPNPMPEPCNGWRWERHMRKVDGVAVDWREAARQRDGVLGGPNHTSGGNTGFTGQSAVWRECDGCKDCSPNGGYVLRKGSWRHTRAHEFVFHLVKDMSYYSDAVSAAVPAKSDAVRTVNPRTVMQVATQPYKGAHFATYPTKLIEPLIQASCPKLVCSKCGEPHAPIIRRSKIDRDVEAERADYAEKTGREDGHVSGPSGKVDTVVNEGYKATCKCNAEPRPGVVLDPFAGSGTTGEVCRNLGLRFVGLDINYDYLATQAKIRAGVE